MLTKVWNTAPRLKITNKITEKNVVFYIRGRGFKINQQNVERKEKTVRCGGLKKAYSSLVTVYYCSPCVFLVSVCQFTKKRVYFWSSQGLD